MRHRRGWRSLPLVVLGMVLVLALGRVSAADSRQGDQCLVGANETVDSDLYVMCNTLTIEGTINGDLVGAAFSTTLAASGHIQGDIWLLGGQLRIDGAVDEDIRFGGLDLDLNTAALQPRSDVAAIALNVEVMPDAVLPGDLLVLGYQAIVRGEVGGDASFNGSALVIEGRIGQNVFATVGGGDAAPSFIPFPFPFSVSFQVPGLTVREAGQIAGDLSYNGPRAGNISGRIGGAIDFQLVLPRPDITQATETQQSRPGEIVAAYLRAALTDVLALMTAGVIVLLIAPAWVRSPSQLAPQHVTSSFGWGLILSLLAAPVGLILILASILLLVIVGTITLGGFTWMGLLLLLILNLVVIGGMLFVILFLARLVISDVIGRRLIHTSDRLAVNLLSLLLGTVVYALLTNIPLPYIGLVINALGVFIGLGAIVLHARQLYQHTVHPAYPAQVQAGAPEVAAPPLLHSPTLEVLLGNAPPPPPDSTEPPGPGMANLPTGFRWWGSEHPSDEE